MNLYPHKEKFGFGVIELLRINNISLYLDNHSSNVVDYAGTIRTGQGQNEMRYGFGHGANYTSAGSSQIFCRQKFRYQDVTKP